MKNLNDFYKKFIDMNYRNQMIFLSKLLYIVSMMARGTYECGTLNVVQPELLRRYNELLHRIATHSMDIAKGELERIPDKIFFEMISEEIMNIGISDAVLKMLNNNKKPGSKALGAGL